MKCKYTYKGILTCEQKRLRAVPHLISGQRLTPEATFCASMEYGVGIGRQQPEFRESLYGELNFWHVLRLRSPRRPSRACKYAWGTGVARVRVVMISKPHIQIVTHKSETELLFVHLRSFNHPPTIHTTIRFML